MDTMDLVTAFSQLADLGADDAARRTATAVLYEGIVPPLVKTFGEPGRALVEDAAQDVFVRAWYRGMGSALDDPPTTAPRVWKYFVRSIRNRMGDLRRQAKATSAAADDGITPLVERLPWTGPTPEEDAITDEEILAWERHKEQLGRDLRETVESCRARLRKAAGAADVASEMICSALYQILQRLDLAAEVLGPEGLEEAIGDPQGAAREIRAAWDSLTWAVVTAAIGHRPGKPRNEFAASFSQLVAIWHRAASIDRVAAELNVRRNTLEKRFQRTRERILQHGPGSVGAPRGDAPSEGFQRIAHMVLFPRAAPWRKVSDRSARRVPTVAEDSFPMASADEEGHRMSMDISEEELRAQGWLPDPASEVGSLPGPDCIDPLEDNKSEGILAHARLFEPHYADARIGPLEECGIETQFARLVCGAYRFGTSDGQPLGCSAGRPMRVRRESPDVVRLELEPGQGCNLVRPDGAAFRVWRDGDGCRYRKLVPVPSPLPHSDVAAWPGASEPEWLRGECLGRILSGEPWQQVVAAGLVLRYQPEAWSRERVRALFERIREGTSDPEAERPRRWALDWTAAEAAAVEDAAVGDAIRLRTRLEGLREDVEIEASGGVGDAAWRAELTAVCESRDDLEGVRLLLAARRAGQRLDSVLTALDRAAGAFVHSLPPLGLSNSRLTRAREIVEGAWWVAVLERA